MSIYATQWILKFPRYGDAHMSCEWIDVIGQGVPAHIGTPSLGYGYENGDPYAAFLPPAITVDENDENQLLRAIVIVKADTEKVGQEYIAPLVAFPVPSMQRCRSRRCTTAFATPSAAAVQS